MATKENQLLVWVDVETTGLGGPSREALLEVGFVITDKYGEYVDNTHFLTPIKGQESLVADSKLSPFIKKMHTKSGLLKEIRTRQSANEFVDMHDEQKRLYKFFREYFKIGDPRPELCGSVVSFDKEYVQYYFPLLCDDVFHYRVIDVSSIKQLCLRHNPRLFEMKPVDRNMHRVAPDIEDSINEYRFYLDNFLFITDGD